MQIIPPNSNYHNVVQVIPGNSNFRMPVAIGGPTIIQPTTVVSVPGAVATISPQVITPVV